MKRTKLLLVAALALVICLPGMALASTVTFDSLTADQDSNAWGFVPTSYEGFTWTGFEFITNTAFQSYGNIGNFTSTPNAAYNGGTGNLTVTVNFGAQRDVLDAYFRSFSQNNAFQSYSAHAITLEGLDALGNVIGTALVLNLSSTAMLDYAINFTGVNQLRITSDAAGHYWVMDNLTTVPIPPSALLLGSGLLGLVGLGWRRRKTA
jgi:hypothetical protein